MPTKVNVKYKLSLIVKHPKEESDMALDNKNLTAVLYSIEGVGAVFVVIFLAAYLGGIPTTNVLQNQPAFRIPLTVLGVVILILILAGTILAVKYRK
ncbi:MAG: hypothetical protein ABSF44_14570 [Candidatus Bathyarchaeia archaeon]|jgi:sterol desaturase/sphingolipid hydroxylase (fatty acid hydroxylase superfamily)